MARWCGGKRPRKAVASRRRFHFTTKPPNHSPHRLRPCAPLRGTTRCRRCPQRGTGTAPAGWSLEHRLPVLIFVLLACVVGGLSLAAYREVRATAVVRATDRLERVGRELLSTAPNTTIARADSLRAVGAGELARARTGRRSVAAGRRGAPGCYPCALRLDAAWVGSWPPSAAGPRYASAAGWSAADSVALVATVDSVTRAAADRRSPFYAVGGAMHSWLVVPVIADAKVVGTVAELRRVGDNRAGEAAIIGLIDDGAGILLTSRGSSEWLSLRGRPMPAPFALPAVEGRAVRADGPDGAAYAVQFAVPTTPWTLVLFQSEASVLRRPYEFLRRMLGAGSVVLALAILGAWLLSRHRHSAAARRDQRGRRAGGGRLRTPRQGERRWTRGGEPVHDLQRHGRRDRRRPRHPRRSQRRRCSPPTRRRPSSSR